VPISSFYGARDVRSHVRFCFAKREETLQEAGSRLAQWNNERKRRAA
jgi:aspartate/methionine/tyrosine aminotransferase